MEIFCIFLYSLGFSEKQTGKAGYFFCFWLMDWVFEFSKEMIYGQDKLRGSFLSKTLLYIFEKNMRNSHSK